MGCAIAVVAFVILLNLMFWKTAPITIPILLPFIALFLYAVWKHEKGEDP